MEQQLGCKEEGFLGGQWSGGDGGIPAHTFLGAPESRQPAPVLWDMRDSPLALEAEQKQLWGAWQGAQGTPAGSQDSRLI